MEPWNDMDKQYAFILANITLIGDYYRNYTQFYDDWMARNASKPLPFPANFVSVWALPLIFRMSRV